MFIKVTISSNSFSAQPGEEVFVNIDHIITIRKMGNFTRVETMKEDFIVKETLREIDAIIKTNNA